jgi:hypothetical protein
MLPLWNSILTSDLIRKLRRILVVNESDSNDSVQIPGNSIHIELHMIRRSRTSLMIILSGFSQ